VSTNLQLAETASPVLSNAQEADRNSARFVDFKEYLLNTARKIESINADSELERLRLIVKMRKFYSGYQVGLVSKATNRWVDKKKRGDARYVDPILQTFVDINAAQIVKSRATLKVRARSSDRVDKVEAARYAEELLKDAQLTLFKAQFLQKEAKLWLQLSGETYRITDFAADVKGTEVRIPVTESKPVNPSVSVWDCAACGKSGETEEEGSTITCPNCGYTKADVIRAEGFNAPVVTGYREVPAGDIVCESPDPLEMKVIGGEDGIGEALAVTRDRLIMRGVLERLYPNVKIPSTSNVPLKLQYTQDLKLDSPQAGVFADTEGEAAQGGEQFELLHFKEVWLDVAAYGGYTFQKETKLPESVKPEERTVVQEGTKLEDVKTERGSYSQGAYYCKVGDVVLDIYPCDKRKHLTHCVNNIGEGFHGLGEWDLLPLQEQKNELRSLMFAKEMFDSVAPTMVRTAWVDAKKLAQARSTPNAIIQVNNIPDEVPLSSAVARIPPGQGVTGSYQLDGIIGQSMQYRTGASTLESGAPDLIGKNKTATAVNAAQSQSEGRRGPMLQLRAEMEQEQGYQILELRKENWPPQMYATLDKKVGGDAGRWFRESDIRRDFRIEIVPESWWPQTAEQRKEDLAGLRMYANPADPTVVKALWQRATELYGRGLDLNSYQSDRVEARIRLEKLKQVADVLENQSGVSVYDAAMNPLPQMVDLCLEKARLIPELPVLDAEGQPVSCNPILDRHPEYITSYSEWLLTSEGRETTPFTRAVINKVIISHYAGQTAQASFLKGEEMKTMLPEKQAELISNEMDFNQSQELESKQAEQQMQLASQAADMQTEQAVKEALLAKVGRDAGVLPEVTEKD
jgi:hypothetical protein